MLGFRRDAKALVWYGSPIWACSWRCGGGWSPGDLTLPSLFVAVFLVLGWIGGGEGSREGGARRPSDSRQLLTSRMTDETHVPGMRAETGMDLGRVLVASMCKLVWLWPTDIHSHLRRVYFLAC